MVMRNPHDRPGGRDDLPPRIADRLRGWPRPEPAYARKPLAPAEPPPPPGREWVGDLVRIVALLLAVAVGQVLFLLVALSYLSP